MAFNISCAKAVLSASPEPTPKRCELPLFLAALGQAVGGWTALDHSSSANRVLSDDISLLEVLPRKVALHTSSHLVPIEA